MARLRFALVVGIGLTLTASLAAQQPEQKKNAMADRAARYPQAPPATGSAALPFSLSDLEGKQVSLNELIGKKPIVIEFGSYT